MATSLIVAVTLFVINTANDYCDYYKNGIVTVDKLNKLYDSITIYGGSITIKSKIQLNNYCSTLVCNIFHFGDDNFVYPSLSINGITNEFELSMTNAGTRIIYEIPDASQLLPVDDIYHGIEIYISPSHQIFTINNISYDYYTELTENEIDNIATYPFYASNPWKDDIDAHISNICIQSAKGCGDSVKGELKSASDNHYYRINIFNNSTILFDACESLFDTYIFLLTDNYQILAENNDVCRTRSQLYIPFKKAGQFILAISGSGNDTYHDYGAYELTINCAQHDHSNIQCGDTLNGWITSEKNIYNYYFTLSNDIQVAFSACDSSDDIDTAMQLIDYNYTLLFHNDYDNRHCTDDNSYLSVPLLSKGRYILGLRGTVDVNIFKSSGYPEWKLTVKCEEIDTAPYRLPDVNVKLIRNGISSAKEVCQEFYGTSLATIITDDDALQLSKLLQQPPYYITNVYVGMYTSMLKGNKWQWMDGTSCKYTSSGNCVDDIHWSNNEPYVLDTSIEDAVYWSSEYNRTGLYVDHTFDMLDTAACNAPKPYGRYSEINCTNDKNCWVKLDNIKDCDSIKDSIDLVTKYNDLGRIPIVFWKSRLFLIAPEFIHYTNNSFDIFQNYYGWNDFRYNPQVYSFDTVDIDPRYTRYQESLYIFGWKESLTDKNGFTKTGTLVRINLTNWNIISYDIDIEFSSNTISILSDFFGINYMTNYIPPIFLVANGSHVYVITIGSIIICNLQTGVNTQNPFDSVDEPIASVATNDGKHIFIFGRYFETIKKYDIDTGKFKTLDTVNLCFYITYGIAAINGKIYLHGCHSSYWKTMIFNPKSETFEQETVNIDYPLSQYMADYWRGTIEVIDDNVLLLAHLTNPSTPIYNTVPKTFGMNFYYSITDLISINLQDTQKYNVDIWPSDGFQILYFVNDFDQSSDYIYKMWFYSQNTMYIINTSITLNTSNDNCICNASSYKCYKCRQHFNLQNYLHVLDNHVTSFQFVPMADYCEQNITLILPQTILITLQRCFIFFNPFTKSTTNNHPYIILHYKLSKNCYTRIGNNYSFNMTSQIVNINKQIIIGIMGNENHICHICDGDVCSICHNDTFEMKHKILEHDATLQILFQSNMIDFGIDSDSNNLQIEYSYTPPFALTNHEIAGIIIGGLIVLSVIVGLMFCWCRNRKKLKQETARRVKHAKDIHNPMVISIGIANYFEDVENPGVDVHCNDLRGIDRDFENILQFCELCKYDYFPKCAQFEWTQKQMIDFLTQCAQIGNDNISDDTIPDNQKYDAILLVISGHGYQNSIISSDYQLITKTAIHRIFSVNFPTLRLIPRLCIFDCCNGTDERAHFALDLAESSDDDSDKKETSFGKSVTPSTEQGKNFDVDDIETKRNYVWGKNQTNPDYLLALIHGANEGFQAKMNSIDGSYLIYEFVKGMMNNIEENKDLFLVEIMDEIQRYLHDDIGKQQIITNYNSFTQYLRFKVKIGENDITNENNQSQDVMTIAMIHNTGKHADDNQTCTDFNTSLLD